MDRFLRRKKIQGAPEAITADSSSVVDECERLAALVKEARKRLEPLAASKKPKTDLFGHLGSFSLYSGMGGETGCGMLIRLARISLDAHGCVSAAELQRFKGEMGEVFEGLLTSITSIMVNCALMLTVYVVLALTEARGFLEMDLADGVQPSAFGPDGVAWLVPGENQQVVRRAFYVVEGVLLALALVACMVGLVISGIYLNIIPAMPGKIELLELLVTEIRHVFPLYLGIDVSQWCFPLVLPFVAARYSGVAFCAGCFVTMFAGFWVWGLMMSTVTNGGTILQRSAVSALAKAAREKRNQPDNSSLEPVGAMLVVPLDS